MRTSKRALLELVVDVVAAAVAECTDTVDAAGTLMPVAVHQQLN